MVLLVSCQVMKFGRSVVPQQRQVKMLTGQNVQIAISPHHLLVGQSHEKHSVHNSTTVHSNENSNGFSPSPDIQRVGRIDLNPINILDDPHSNALLSLQEPIAK